MPWARAQMQHPLEYHLQGQLPMFRKEITRMSRDLETERAWLVQLSKAAINTSRVNTWGTEELFKLKKNIGT